MRMMMWIIMRIMIRKYRMTITKEKNKDDDNVYDEDKIEVED